jgi:hypothetical protein
MAENDPKSDRLSLHGMTPEDAIRKVFGAKPLSKTDYAIGRRVKIADHYYSANLRGAIGTIIEPPDDFRDLLRLDHAWVEFDEVHDDEEGDSVQGGEFLLADLIPA